MKKMNRFPRDLKSVCYEINSWLFSSGNANTKRELLIPVIANSKIESNITIKPIFKPTKKSTDMKKIITSAAFVVFFAINSCFAAKTDGTFDNIQTSFKKEFKNAEVIKWEKFRVYSKATFSLNNKVMFAYYSNDGQLLAVSRNLLSSELPIGLMLDLKTSYAGYWITDLCEIRSNEGSTYRVRLENADHSLILKSDNMNFWETEQRKNKNQENK
jgi:hypothetical protein